LRPVIQSRKHYVQTSLSAIVGTNIVTLLLSEAKEGQHTASTDVSEGAIVKAVYVEMWFENSANNLGSFTMIVYKNPGGANSPTSAEVAALHDYDNKKNILYSTQGILPPSLNFPMQGFKGWIKIPKGKQRQGLGDKIQITIRNNTTDDLNFCGLTVFKEYT